jgi:endonuclease YncB( thermonuclease family)
MRPLTTIALVILSATAQAAWTGKVVGVHDGDTISVLHDGKAEKIRLVEIDAPELSQDFGQQSKQYLSKLCFGQTATIDEHGQDRYGRLLARVKCNGINANVEQVKRGMAWFFTKYGTDLSIKAYQEQAKQQSIGLWSMSNAMPPWEYRHAPSATTGTATILAAQSSNTTPTKNKGAKSANEKPASGAYSCSGGKKYCKDMTSCEEATFYLNQCGHKNLDRDGDGKPCENVCG